MSTAVVTGGTKGIGLAVAHRLAELGHRTVVLARSVPGSDGEEDTHGLEGLQAIACDVSDPESVERVFAAIGEVEVLVNNAGIATSNPIGRTTLEQWEACHAVNATGPFLCTQAVLAGMRDRDLGRIVTVASTASLHGSHYTAAYTASKHAVLGFMRVLAIEIEGTGVSASSVCPTYVRTEMTEQTIRNIVDKTGLDLAAAEARLAQSTPHGRIIEVAEVADAVIELIVSGANGRELVLDGSAS